MRLVILPLIIALATAALSGCLDFEDDCSSHSYGAAHDDGQYEYEYEYEYEYDYDHGGSYSHGHSQSHASSYAYAGASGSDENERYETSCYDEDDDHDYEEHHDNEDEAAYYIPDTHDDEPHISTSSLAPVIDPLYSGAWSGSGDIDDGFVIEEPYGFVLTHMIHQGQTLGDGFRYTDPEEGEMDHACLVAAAGQTIMTRSLPPSEGHVTFRFDGRFAGQTTFDAWGYRGHTAPTYLYLLHQGERADLPVPIGTSMDFYVPEGSGEIEVSLLHQGQAILGARLYDADGTEVAKLSSSTGQEARTTTSEGVGGIWTLELDGMRAGQFQVSIRPTTVGETPELPAPEA